ncbi:RICIN domain-containing protein [Dactylosporangium vinaceum]|uniref:Pectinesterase family protein n=1 Tax=Dactylosporangium vinaceum TaxID=53362 RepID=A0ABV5MSW5_9ACTN|nr:pectinesterase family protein [Dactylosporangium vinaceum]UAB97666.1 RICIN domain-containing protein [Dactylosporangium vinaceum]
MSVHPRRSLVALVAAAVPVAVLAVAWPSEAATTPVSGGVYTLASGASGKCVEVAGASTAGSALLVQLACDSAATDQQWTARQLSSGRFQLVNGNSAKCIDVPSSSTTSGTRLQQYSCGDSTKNNQLWTFAASTATTGKYLVKSVASGLCISDRDGSTAGNNPIVEETCSDIARMQWSFNSVTGSTTAPSGSAVVAKDGSGQYSTIQAAVDAVPAGNTTRRVITIKAGTYRESVVIPANKPYITFQGLGSGPSNTVIVNDKPASTAGTTGSATVYVQSRDFQATNLTFSNDYDEAANGSSQALALALYGDRAVLKNVRVTADQDTLLIYNSARAYVANSYIEGTVDFIYGNGQAVFNACSIYEKRSTGGPLTAANTPSTQTYGFLVYRSTITGATNNTTQLGRPWGAAAQVTYRESSLSATIATAQPWIDMSSNSWKNARFYEYRNTGAGATVNGNRRQLSDAEAANYTPQKYLAGSDGWNPIG